ncbi:MAG: Flp pilus assembly protein CpaB [Planctomycetota bacterium]
MKRWSIVGLLLLGLAAATFAAMLVKSLQAGVAPGAGRSASQKDTEVLVAARAVPANTVIDADSFTVRKVPRSNVPRDAMLASTDVVGRVVVTPLVKGEVFTASCFADQKSGARLAAKLPAGMLAMSVALANFQALEGLLYPGSKVDVVVSLDVKDPDDATEPVSFTLLQNVEVLGIEHRTVVSEGEERSSNKEDRSGQRGRTMVTLMVNSSQAEALHLATTRGTVSLALRNPSDGESSKSVGVSLRELSEAVLNRWTPRQPAVTTTPPPPPVESRPPEPPPLKLPEPEPAPAAKPAPPAPPPTWQTVVLRGTASETFTFPIKDEAKPN